MAILTYMYITDGFCEICHEFIGYNKVCLNYRKIYILQHHRLSITSTFYRLLKTS